MSAIAATVLKASRKRLSEEETRNRTVVREALVNEQSISKEVADAFAKRHAFLPHTQVLRFVEELAQHHRDLHLCHRGYPIGASVLNRAMELCLQRLSRSHKGLSERQLSYFSKLARDQIASQAILYADPGTPSERENVLKPLQEVLICEHDKMTRDRLMFIFRLFVDNGLRLAKIRVLKACMSEKNLFPTKRAIEDALETLRGSYEALRFLEGEFFVAPEYLTDGP